MLARLALRNVRRSARDYGIYFVTILLGVSVFYAFNSIPSQRVLFDLKAADFGVFSTVNEFMGIFSVVVACVLGFLVVYSNRFLIRRRRYEFGMYLLLGMTSGQVARVVLMETVSVGLLSLVVGLGAGIALSQVLSFATAALFQVDMAQYRLVLSGEAIVRTVLCFALIFAVAAAFKRHRGAALQAGHAALGASGQPTHRDAQSPGVACGLRREHRAAGLCLPGAH